MAALGLALAVVGCSGGSGTESGKSPSTTSASGARPASTGEGNAATGDEVVLGIVASMNGANRPWGVDSVAGAQLAVEEANKAGGVQGKTIKLIVADSNSNAEQGKSAAEKLVSQDKVLVLLGEVASGITLQMADVGMAKGVPVIGIGATRTDLTDKGANIFRVCYTDAMQGPVMARFASEELGLKQVAVITDKQQPYSTGLSDSFKAAFEKLGGKIVDEQFYETGQTQFGGILTNIKSKNPDGLFMSGYFSEAGPIARQAKEAGLDVKMLGGDGWDSSEILQTGGEAILGSFFCNHYNNSEDRQEVKDFLSKWQAKFKQLPATTMAALGYDAAALAIDALKRSTSLDSKALTVAIDQTEGFKGVSGEITLKGRGGNPLKRALVVELSKRDPGNPNDNGQRFRKAYDPDPAVD